jgi:hypothetical protein
MTDPKESDNLQTSRRILKTKTILKNKIHSAISKKAQADNFEILTPGGSPAPHPVQGEGGGGSRVLLSAQAHFWDQ